MRARGLYDEEFLGDDEELAITEFSCSGYNVSLTLMGASKGDPSSIPSRYAEYLFNKVLNKYGDPYFVNIEYSGFDKENPIGSPDDPEQEETIFSFEMSMQLQMGSDEEHTDADSDFKTDNTSTEGNNSEVTE